jgi:hypothetical protein
MNRDTSDLDAERRQIARLMKELFAQPALQWFDEPDARRAMGATIARATDRHAESSSQHEKSRHRRDFS